MGQSRRRILLVDDDTGVLKVYGKRLELAGYSVIGSGDGDDALAKVKERQPDLIILDVMLPKLNGYEVCVRLEQDPATKGIPIIMFTAKGKPQEHLAGLMSGADAYISKSCQAKVLLDQVASMLPESPEAR